MPIINRGNICAFMVSALFLTSFQLTTALIGCSPAETPVASDVKIEFHLAESAPGNHLKEMEVQGRKLYLYPEIVLSNEDIQGVELTKDEFDKPALRLVFRDESSQKIKDLSSKNIDRQLALLIDGKVIIAPVIRSRISKEVQVTGDFTLDELIDLHQRLTAGKKQK